MENRARMGKITITLREDHLPEGIVLAGKCRILRTLRMGEFSVTYEDRKSTRLNSSNLGISYAVFCLKKKKKKKNKIKK